MSAGHGARRLTRTAQPLSLTAYQVLTGLAEPFAPFILRRRAGRGREDASRLSERLGHASRPRPDGDLIWLHGASVGESLSLLPLISMLQEAKPEAALLVTSGTVTSAQLLSKRLPPGVEHQFAPVDAPGAVKRFVAHWRPTLAIFAESELWPNLILKTSACGCAMALVSAKISQRSAAGWARWPDAAKSILSCFDLILAQDAHSAERLSVLGRPADGLADLKYGAQPLPHDDGGLAAIRAQLGRRTILLAASTHPGEDAIVLEALKRSGVAETALLIIAPRHPERGAQIAALARVAGLTPALRSLGEPPGVARVYIADTLGEIGLWLRLAQVAFIGGSLVTGVGGHNPLEPARLGCPAASGPHVVNWQSAYDDLGHAGGVEFVRDASELAALFDRPVDALNAMAARAADQVAMRDAEALRGLARILALAP